MTAKRRHRVTEGNSHLTVYPWTHPATKAKRWRFAFKEGTKWKYRTFKTKVAAEHAAGKILEEAPAGLVWTGLDTDSQKFLEEIHRRTPPADRPALLAFLRSRDSSAEIAAAVAAFIAHKTSEAGELTPHLAAVASTLGHLAAAFPGRRVSEIHLPELAAWWTTRGTGKASKTQRDLRAVLVTFWRWALRQGLAGSEPITVAERLPAVRVATGEKRVLTAAELCAVLNAIEPAARAWAILGAFAGLRPDEIAPGTTKKAAKRGLHCEEIDWQFKVIRLPAVVSKTNRPRIIPMSDALIAGLQWAGIAEGMHGLTTMNNPSQTHQLARLGRDLFNGTWPKDSLRHSYGSYRNAILRNLDQVSEEMGNSVAMLHRHYHNPQPQQLGDQWFALRPNKSAANCSDGDPMKSTFWSVPPETSGNQILIPTRKPA
jgi:integrase